ncbi:hypothetical protein H257_07478 [Aphanomyces astaci]|uniref:Enoyl-CoA hydratase n=1 Tax=Aphanomyces astaci TaxID=112090 RepID=W4GJG8_APHAT|nr:hypothetical protein H257_07478 [Aphanomyces astaci]ETV79481.1 hypothetical protein H257_07478 [Aphanomyces astaci]|eukprot:XP_009831322.1 hypothetical protein H257_07478 [Aphanomyces astaci]
MIHRSMQRVVRPCVQVRHRSDKALIQSWIQPHVATPLHETRYDTLTITPSLADDLADSDPSIVNLRLNRPTKLNAFNMQMWNELESFFQQVEATPSVRAVVIRGEGRGFSSGMDLQVFAAMQEIMGTIPCDAKKRERLMQLIRRFQHIVSAPERSRVPVIAAVHGICWGGAVDFITACDLRVCDISADFSVKEIDLAIVADVGTLQRLPLLVGEQRAKELSYTGRSFFGTEAERIGLVLEAHVDSSALFAHAASVAASIASKSPVTIRGIKKTIQYRRDHTTDDSLRQVEHWNAAMLQSEDLVEAFTAMTSKKTPQFRD